jgi:hypothetical protein
MAKGQLIPASTGGLDPRAERAFLAEIIVQSRFADKAYDGIQGAKGGPQALDVFYYIQSFMVATACLSRILWPVAKGKLAKAAVVRGSHLRTVLQVTDQSPLRRRELRNRLEHFDEDIEEWSMYAPTRLRLDFAIALGGKTGTPPQLHDAAGHPVPQRSHWRSYTDPPPTVHLYGQRYRLDELASATKELQANVDDRLTQLGPLGL